MSEYSIEVKNISKLFGQFKAVDNISFNVKKGEIFGFLGANGAGKSTTIRMLCALLEPTSGSATVGGFDVVKYPEKVKSIIGYMSQKFSLYEDLTVLENINFLGGIYGLSKDELKSKRNWVIKLAGLEGREKELTGNLAGGWKQRLALGCAIIHNPKILFLDEPTGGVDPISRRNFWNLINNLSEKGTTIFVTTHFLDEAEYCNTIYLMHAGKIVAGDSPTALKSKYLVNPVFELECSDPIKAMEYLSKENYISNITIFGMNLHVDIINSETDLDKIKNLLMSLNIEIFHIQKIIPSLEDVFVHLIETK